MATKINKQRRNGLILICLLLGMVLLTIAINIIPTPRDNAYIAMEWYEQEGYYIYQKDPQYATTWFVCEWQCDCYREYHNLSNKEFPTECP